jgi:translation initiation factor IF-2
MNVSELARQLRTNPKELMELLPQYGFDVGARAVKIDDRVANQIVRRWPFIKRDLEEKKRKAAEEKKQKEKELRREQGQSVSLPDLITVRHFAERLQLPVTAVMTELMKNGILANQNQNIDYDTAAIMAAELGFAPMREVGESTEVSKKEDVRTNALEAALQKSTAKESRPPVIVVMGHVDHGKTTLLDTIRKANIAAKESGGITQHIGAYQTVWKDPKTKSERALTFIDTPGHEAFTVMRSRGAKVADMAILVVAADDGVKPQTEEVIQIIRAAKLPVVVAINKIDKPGADLNRVKTELSERGMQPEDWGGDVPFVEISAKNNLNIDKLLDVLLLVADLNAETIQADSSIPAVGTIIESHVNKQTGPLATILVQAGTLRKNDPLVVNNEIYGKVRAMRNYRGELIDVATPSVPAQILGFKVPPEVGDILDVSSIGTAEDINIKAKRTDMSGAQRTLVTRAERESGDEEHEKKTLNLVIKADVLGSLEAIIGSMEKIHHDEVGVKIIGKGLGNVSADDVSKAEAGNGILIAFNVNASPDGEAAIREKNIPFMKYKIIYDLINWVKEELEKMLDRETIVKEVGIFKVMQIFRTDKNSMIVGGRVENGKIAKDTLARVKRSGEIIGSGKVSLVKSGKQEVKEVPSGSECGIQFDGKIKVEDGDVLEIYTEELKTRKIIFK